MGRLPPQTSLLLLVLAIAAFAPVQSRSNFDEDVGTPLRKPLQGAAWAARRAWAAAGQQARKSYGVQQRR